MDNKVRELFLHETRKLGELPLLPSVAREVMALLNDPSTGMDRGARVVRRDPALAAQLLKVANSAAYGGRSPAPSLPSALVRLGSAGVKRLLLSSSAARVLVVSSRPELTARLQTRSIAVASASARVAAHFGTDAEAAFLAGLLHDVGWAVGFGLVPRLSAALPPEYRSPAAIDHLVDALHPEVGTALAEGWKLPPNAIDAIRAHHRPAEMGGGLMAFAVYAASRICDGLGVGPCEPLLGEVSADPVMRRLKLDPDACAQIGRQVLLDLR